LRRHRHASTCSPDTGHLKMNIPLPRSSVHRLNLMERWLGRPGSLLLRADHLGLRTAHLGAVRPKRRTVATTAKQQAIWARRLKRVSGQVRKVTIGPSGNSVYRTCQYDKLLTILGVRRMAIRSPAGRRQLSRPLLALGAVTALAAVSCTSTSSQPSHSGG